MSDYQTDTLTASAPPVPSRPQASILIVDDTPANLRLLSQMLAEQGYHVRPVPDGPLALAAVQAELPDLILLDIRMPDMDGYQVCERLKADAQTRDIPIIFISALDATEDKVRAFQAGGVDYVTKPFQAAEVLARLETHLALRGLQKELLDANERMARELSLAGEVQASFLPRKVPEIPGWLISAALKPAREASGDFYDFVSLPDGLLGIVMADVSGKGAGAALYMALSCTLMRTFVQHYPAEPDLVLNAVNRRILADTSAHEFVTVFYGILDPGTGRLVYSSGGHCPALHVHTKDGHKVHRLLRTGIPLGIFEDKTWEQETVQLDPGDVLILYTDGVTEAYVEPPSLFGEERLLTSVQTTVRAAEPQQLLPQEIQDGILADVSRFVGGAPQSDDIALAILVRR
jgi:sigma-B regulation protein RsbU (phosphoserine phosphatase)